MKDRNTCVDALKGLAILSIVFFHAGWFKYGYFGVDVFYAIAGYFTTVGIVRAQCCGTFNPFRFVWSRVLRVLPVVLALVFVCFVLGVLFYLPIGMMDICRNGAAGCLFVSNLDMWRSANDYWGTTNEVNPLMHLWYLGTLMQFYLVYALLWWPGKRVWTMPLVLVLGAASCALRVFGVGDISMQYYLLPWRFFEFAIGAALAVYSGLLKPFARCASVGKYLHLLPVLGTSSLSIYIWHQPILAFVRYLHSRIFTIGVVIGMLVVLVVVSWFSHKYLERKIETRRGRWMLGAVWGLLLILTLATWQNSGVCRAIPEFDVSFGRYQKGFVYKYNDRIRSYTADFVNDGRVKVLVVGDSYSRDWANVLLESSASNRVDLVYCVGEVPIARRQLLAQADVIFFSCMVYSPVPEYLKSPKTWVVGTKYYGETSQTYTRRFFSGYADWHAKVPEDIAARNESDKVRYGDRFVDMIGLASGPQGLVRCFTDDGKFISIDSGHLAPAGARYYARLIEANGLLDRLLAN